MFFFNGYEIRVLTSFSLVRLIVLLLSFNNEKGVLRRSLIRTHM